jgi:hypothetical protein
VVRVAEGLRDAIAQPVAGTTRFGFGGPGCTMTRRL